LTRHRGGKLTEKRRSFRKEELPGRFIAKILFG